MNKAINKFCPRSGKPVRDDSLTEYRGFTVGFCNSGCRDDFANNTEDCQSDTSYFDVVIKENEL
ncbi:YHS domain-containing protein [Alteromonas sp. ASW11-130]|uniref:YHS domain-containing protein n=1 Tax=Alteromonas sp. ASW11-130 TaxID=3015775 RepID=UPI0022420874|nr:YHS domain-containing protein [Alteromonas sp. ASW11-130]MCW8092130.1 YHS domain-containing protein [Alteromonas sp. ASW11-130]